MICALCDQPIHGGALGHYRMVVGWEQIRRGGGANKIARREETGDWAHRGCVDAKQSMKGQETLWR